MGTTMGEGEGEVEGVEDTDAPTVMEGVPDKLTVGVLEEEGQLEEEEDGSKELEAVLDGEAPRVTLEVGVPVPVRVGVTVAVSVVVEDWVGSQWKWQRDWSPKLKRG